MSKKHKTSRILCKNCCKPCFQLSGSDQQSCFSCTQSLEIYGQPLECKTCGLLSAFGVSPNCRHCCKMITKYGEPIPCSICLKICAFNRPDNVIPSCYACSLQTRAESKHELPQYKRVNVITLNKKRPRTGYICIPRS